MIWLGPHGSRRWWWLLSVLPLPEQQGEDDAQKNDDGDSKADADADADLGAAWHAVVLGRGDG